MEYQPQQQPQYQPQYIDANRNKGGSGALGIALALIAGGGATFGAMSLLKGGEKVAVKEATKTAANVTNSTMKNTNQKLLDRVAKMQGTKGHTNGASFSVDGGAPIPTTVL